MRTLTWRHLAIGITSGLLLTASALGAQGARPDADDGDGFRRGGFGISVFAQGGRDQRRDPRSLRGYQDPAFARGYSDGWEKGADDRRDRDRYDPVRHHDYRDADDGYSRDYGSKNAYKNNYRAGFRQGYEDGFRNGRRWRR